MRHIFFAFATWAGKNALPQGQRCPKYILGRTQDKHKFELLASQQSVLANQLASSRQKYDAARSTKQKQRRLTQR